MPASATRAEAKLAKEPDLVAQPAAQQPAAPWPAQLAVQQLAVQQLAVLPPASSLARPYAP